MCAKDAEVRPGARKSERIFDVHAQADTVDIVVDWIRRAPLHWSGALRIQSAGKRLTVYCRGSVGAQAEPVVVVGDEFGAEQPGIGSHAMVSSDST